MDRDGQNPRQLTTGNYEDRNPHFRFGGAQIVFFRVTPGSPPTRDVCVVNPDGTGFTNLTLDVQTDVLNPKYSWDGTRIAFARWVGPLNFDLWIMNVDGTNKQAVLTGATNDTSPFFSLDGQWLVFNRVVGDPEDQQLQLCRVPAAGGQVVGLTNPADFDELPAFSPDGAHIIYKHGGPPDICRIPSDHLPGDNSTMENLTNTPTQSEDSPQYSYEGDKIAFMRGTTGLPRAPRSGS